MSAGSLRRRESFRRVELGSLAEDLDRVSLPSLRLHPPDIGETEPLPPDWHGGDDGCVHRERRDQPGWCRCGAQLLTGDPDWVEDAGGLSAGNAPTEQETTEMAITSSERVRYTRPMAPQGRPQKGKAMTIAQSSRGRLPVPADLADLVPTGTEFVVEISEAGVLFKPAAMVEETRKANLPAWAKNGGAAR